MDREVGREYGTGQEQYWASEERQAYIERNTGPRFLAGATALLARILKRAPGVGSAIEFGANVGTNLRALRTLLPEAELAGIEINAAAVGQLRALDGVRVYHRSILEFEADESWDLAFTKNVLIHINPERLGEVYDRLYAASRRYIVLIEYYNPTPVTVSYRGKQDLLFKRDFAGELMDRFGDLRLVDYGFAYHRDHNFRQDDVTWFLLEKAGSVGSGRSGA